jgi:hypothetical protein
MAKHCKRNTGFPIENLSTFCQLEKFANGDMRLALDNNKSARDNIKFVTEEVDKLINKGCVSLVTEKPYLHQPVDQV